MTDPTAAIRWRQASVIFIWLVTILGAVLIGLLAGEDYVAWIVMALGASVVLTLCVQLALRRKEGFLARVTASLVGSMLVLAVASGILLIVASTG